VLSEPELNFPNKGINQSNSSGNIGLQKGSNQLGQSKTSFEIENKQNHNKNEDNSN